MLSPVTGGDAKGGISTATSTAYGAEAHGGIADAFSTGGPAKSFQNGAINDLVLHLVENNAGAEGHNGVEINQSMDAFTISPMIYMPFEQHNTSDIHDASAIGH